MKRAGQRSRRRDVAVDITMSLLALALGLSVSGSLLHGWDGYPQALRVADLLLGAGGFALLWWRRRYPVQFAAYVLAVSVFTTLISGLTLVAVFTVAEYRRWQMAAGFSFAFAATSWPNLALYGARGNSLAIGTLVAAIATFAFTGWGMFVRARRQLVAVLLAQLDRAEADRRHAVGAARLGERRRIAREMHDVLAHRLSLVAIHAGALELRAGAPPGRVQDAARLIRTTVHDGLEELRAAIDALRDDTSEDPGRSPLPALGDLPALIAQARLAGMTITLAMPADTGDAAPVTARTAYRVVQEALTNAGKHAPGAPVQVDVRCQDGHLIVEIANGAAGRPTASVPGAGLGLIGLRERVSLAGGKLDHHHTADGGYRVRARLPARRAPSDVTGTDGA